MNWMIVEIQVTVSALHKPQDGHNGSEKRLIPQENTPFLNSTYRNFEICETLNNLTPLSKMF
jgi:hypothetical protein